MPIVGAMGFSSISLSWRGAVLLVGACAAVAVFMIYVLGGSALHSAAAANSEKTFAGASPTARVLFVPLDAHAEELLHDVVPQLQAWLPANQQLGVLKQDPGWLDTARGEVDYQQAANDILSAFTSAQGTRPVLLMAVTSDAIWDTSIPQYSFVFGGYVWNGQQVAAVFGTRPMRVYQPELERLRLTSFMLRYIGEVLCGLPRDSNPQSVMFTPVLSTVDLDRMQPALPSSCRPG